MRNKISSTVFALTLMISTQVFAANETYRTTFDKVSPNRAVRVSVLVHEYDDYVAGGGFRHVKSSSVIINSELTNSVCEALYGRGAVSNGKAYSDLDLTSEPSFHIAGTNIGENDEMHHKGFVTQGHPYVEFKHLVKIYGPRPAAGGILNCKKTGTPQNGCYLTTTICLHRRSSRCQSDQIS